MEKNPSTWKDQKVQSFVAWIKKLHLMQKFWKAVSKMNLTVTSFLSLKLDPGPNPMGCMQACKYKHVNAF